MNMDKSRFYLPRTEHLLLTYSPSLRSTSFRSQTLRPEKRTIEKTNILTHGKRILEDKLRAWFPSEKHNIAEKAKVNI